MTLFLHEVHRVRGLCEDDFEAHYRDRWMRALCEGTNADEARLLWYAHQAHGSGPAYRIVTVTAVADGAAYQRLVERVAAGDLRTWARELDGLQHDSIGKLLVALPWSPMSSVDLASVPVEPADHELTLYMEDTGWPHAPLDDYTAFWGEVYAPMLERSELLRIEACFQTAHGAGRRPEAILLQKVISHDGLLRLLETETRAELKQPGTFMHDALQVRDQWESRLLRTSAWSPLF
ncbi:MAG TPA: hypothetical protein VHI95_03235 [Acidimicrobiales bacterium]|jgi:hypothetical protein|nr:hypothetical protein [Acidimicrobiales bacterium]